MFGFLKSGKETPPSAKDPVPGAPRLDITSPGPDPTPPARASWSERLKASLRATREQLNRRAGSTLGAPIGEVGDQLAGLFGLGRKIDEALFEELETALLAADVGVGATQLLIERLRQRARREALTEAVQLKAALSEAMTELLEPLARPLAIDARPFVIMLAGVNGAGKTTTIGKLAARFRAEGRTVLLAAGDTFRAAAREQLEAWGARNGVTVIAQQSGDPAAVIFDAIRAAQARNIDVVLADTAGRLPTQMHLMDEIRKVKRVIAKALEGAPHEVLLVLDGNTGQNALAQVKAFDAALGVTGLVVTKLDGSARGGVLAAIAREHPLPIRFIGIGEALDDLQPFEPHEFVSALLD
ncbi:MAG: signal recognition particle-docking protein FtsY [Proteobacteria bacterium]|nr:signal recognition particle-docking protein FtsY [Burkholderiales bacterium]